MSDNIKRIVRKYLTEALGVPNNIINESKELYDLIFEELNNYRGDLDTLDGKEFTINKSITINDLTLNHAIIRFDFIDGDNINGIDLAGLTHHSDAKLDEFVLININNDYVKIGFRFVKDNSDLDLLIKYFIDNKFDIISSLSHELKHAYDKVKYPKVTLKKRVEYDASSSKGFRFKPIDNFIHWIYYIHDIENKVRATEVATSMDLKNVTQKDFINFLTSDETYKKLKKIQQFSVENLKEELKQPENIERIRGIFKKLNSPEYDESLPEDELVDKFLKLVYINISNWKTDLMNDRLSTNIFAMFFGPPDKKKEKFFDKYYNEVTKFENNPIKFYEYYEKKFNFVATKMIKKISKLYAMAKQQNESIVNSDLWYKYFVEETKLETKIKPR